MLIPAIIYLKNCSSTNTEIEKYISKEKTLALYTFNQTQGKGQFGNVWECKPELNIAYSLAIEKSQLKISDNLINFHTALILREFLANLTKEVVKIKWPNDIILKNKKISGMLIEKKKMANKTFYVIGIGLNVLQTNFDGLQKAGSLLSLTSKNHQLEQLSQDWHQFFGRRVFEEMDKETLLQDYKNHLFKRNEISVFEINGLRQNGIIKDVDELGFIWIDLENDGLRKFFHKEIQMLY